MEADGKSNFGSLSYKFTGSLPAYIDFEALIKSKDYSDIKIKDESEILWSIDKSGIGDLTQTGILKARLILPKASTGSAKINVEYKC